MRYLAALACLLCVAVVTRGQVVTTNTVTADPSFRVVRGQLYNVYKSQLWSRVNGECVDVLSNAVICREFKTERSVTIRSSPAGRSGAFGGGGGVAYSPPWRVYGSMFILTNYTGSAKIGATISEKALFVHGIRIAGEPGELWDFGLPHVVTVVTTNTARAKPER